MAAYHSIEKEVFFFCKHKKRNEHVLCWKHGRRIYIYFGFFLFILLPKSCLEYKTHVWRDGIPPLFDLVVMGMMVFAMLRVMHIAHQTIHLLCDLAIINKLLYGFRLGYPFRIIYISVKDAYNITNIYRYISQPRMPPTKHLLCSLISMCVLCCLTRRCLLNGYMDLNAKSRYSTI